jgi:hypothetical protein
MMQSYGSVPARIGKSTGERMPVKVTAVGGGRFQVKTPNAVHAKGTTKAKAKAQAKLLNAIDHSDWRPTGKPSGMIHGTR